MAIPAGYGAGAVFEKGSEANNWYGVHFGGCTSYGETGEAGSVVLKGEAEYWTDVDIRECTAETAGAGVFEGNISFWENTYLDACDDHYQSSLKFQTGSSSQWSNVTIEGCCDLECQTTVCEPSSSWNYYDFKECDGGLVDCDSAGDFFWNGSACHRVENTQPDKDLIPPPAPESHHNTNVQTVLVSGVAFVAFGAITAFIVGLWKLRRKYRIPKYFRVPEKDDSIRSMTEMPVLQSSTNSISSSFWNLDELEQHIQEAETNRSDQVALRTDRSNCSSGSGSIPTLHEIDVRDITDRVRVARGSAGNSLGRHFTSSKATTWSYMLSIVSSSSGIVLSLRIPAVR